MPSLSPSPIVQFLDDNGNPLSGGTLRTFQAGTMIPLATYTDSTGGTPNPVQVPLNARGEASIWLGNSLYYMELHSSTGALIWSADNVGGAATISQLSSSTGASIIGYIQLGAGAVAWDALGKLRERVSIEDFMTAADRTNNFLAPGNTDVTYAAQAALNAGAHVEATASIYKIGQITIPSTCKEFFSKNGSKFIPAASVPSGVTVATWITGASLNFASVHGLWASAAKATYPNLTVFGFVTCTNLHVYKNKTDESGKFGIYGANCVQVLVEHNEVNTAEHRGIQFEGAAQASIVICNNKVNGTGIASGIAFELGAFLKAYGNTVFNTTGFGISAYRTENCAIFGNDTYNTVLEGINIEDCNLNDIYGNTCRWPSVGSAGTDMGISVFANAAVAEFNNVSDNIIINSAASGVGIFSSGAIQCSHNTISDNTIVNSNRLNNPNWAGVLMSGTGVQENNIVDNIITDSTPFQRWGVAEVNLGQGTPTNNAVIGNRISGFLTADISTTNTSTDIAMNKADLVGYRPYTPVVTASSGTITTASAVGGFDRRGKMVSFRGRITITTNGTGAGAVNVTLPFTAVSGWGCGKDLSTGKAIAFEINSGVGFISLRNYDNTYPGANGEIIDFGGMMQIA